MATIELNSSECSAHPDRVEVRVGRTNKNKVTKENISVRIVGFPGFVAGHSTEGINGNILGGCVILNRVRQR